MYCYLSHKNKYKRINCALISAHGFHDRILDHPIFTDIRILDGDTSELRFNDMLGGVVIYKARKNLVQDKTNSVIINNWSILK